jgi:murein DD-endopeptidase MepM/ murein hydrolase activator NlpD
MRDALQRSAVVLARRLSGARVLLVCLIAASAAASACGASGDPVTTASRPAVDVELLRETRVTMGRVAPGETLAAILRANDGDWSEVTELVDRAQAIFDVRALRVERPYRVEQSADGRLLLFEYEIDGDRMLRLIRSSLDTGDRFKAEITPIAKTRAVTIVRGAINRETPSLVEAMEASGETIGLALAFADIFGGHVDFNSDLQPGDGFEVVVEKQYRRCDEVPGMGRPTPQGYAANELTPRLPAGVDPVDAEPCRVPAGYGPIVAAALSNGGQRLRAVRFTLEGRPAGYYDEQGRSLKRFLLRSPLKFEPTISSRFSRARMHPILREVRPHLGIDYRAPTGAPVIAVADGIVVQAGVNGDSGKMVRVRHANGFESAYLHLSALTVRVGARVRQGDSVGRVGATGLATGPHLDYRLKRNGAFINPLKAGPEMPPAESIAPGFMTAFADVRDRALAELDGSAAGGTATGHPR